jgi:hypothetical protein
MENQQMPFLSPALGMMVSVSIKNVEKIGKVLHPA